MQAIQLTTVKKIFRGKKGAPVLALAGLSLSVASGEVFGFLGPNGAGKSTTIKILLGLIRPTSGEATILGEDAGTRSALFRIGYLPENPSFYDYLTAGEYLSFVARIHSLSGDGLRVRSEEVLRLVELWDARNRPIRSYSKGMVQRLGIAQTLVHDPDVYILDEPMSGLDPIGRALVKDIILDLKRKGKCVFFSTHITSDVETVCDRVGILVKGELKSVENVGDILEKGVIGYNLNVLEPNATNHRLVYIDKRELASYVVSAQASGTAIASIEPKRKDLESFFLDIVEGKQC